MKTDEEGGGWRMRRREDEEKGGAWKMREKEG